MRAQEELPGEDGDFVFLTGICKKLSLLPEYLNPTAPGHYANSALAIIGTEAGEKLAKLVADN